MTGLKEHETREAVSWKQTAGVVLAVAIVPLCFRSVLLQGRVHEFALLDLRGYLSDVAVILLVAALIVAVGRLSRPLAVASLIVWGLLHYANFETVRVLGALASVHDLAMVSDSTFFFGSALAVSHPLLLGVAVGVSVLLAWRALGRASLPAALVCLLLSGVAWGAHAAWPFTAEEARWRQVDFFQDSGEILLGRAVAGGHGSSRFLDSQSAMLDLMPSMVADLDGEPIVEMPKPGLNVLLVILESVSGLHVRPLARDHGWTVLDHMPLMPRLSALARSNLSYSTFFAHQRRTNRGVYSVLCGDLPTLRPGLAKMSAYVEGGRVCLPEALRRAGYETAYLQAAPLAFMMKDQFMPRAGFNQVYGSEFFERGYAQSRWGVDDIAMLEQSIPLIEELDAGDKPWFLTMLTVGTHHPFIFPENFQQGQGTDMQRSIAYLDLAIAGFEKRLKDIGVRDDTLILFTSDESAASAGLVTQNWGYLIVQTPNNVRGVVSEPFGQMDIALSVLDYLGLGDQGAHLFGRSVFRRYAEPRWIFFSNTNLDYLGAKTPEGDMLLCSASDTACEKNDVQDGRFFSQEITPIEAERGEFEMAREMASRSIAGRATDADRVFEMMVDPTVVVHIPKGQLDQMIHGGQYVDMKVGEWVEVELELDARGEPDATTTIVHYIRSRSSGQLRRWMIPISPGETLRLHYTFAAIAPVDTVQTRTYATRESDLPVELEFKTARMTYHRSGDTPDFGVQVETREVVATGPSPLSSNQAPSPQE